MEVQLPSRQRYIKYSIKVLEEKIIPLPNNQLLPSSSATPFEFYVEFSLQNIELWYLTYISDSPMYNYNQNPTTKSWPIKLVSDQQASWIILRIALSTLGLESNFHDQVERVLRYKFNHFCTSFHHNDHGRVPRKVQVLLSMNIKRYSVTRTNDMCVLVAGLGLDDDVDNSDDDVVQGLEIMKDEEVLLYGDKSCAICLAELQTVGSDSKEKKDVAMKLPCKHVFHRGCLIKWFMKIQTCPICRFKLH